MDYQLKRMIDRLFALAEKLDENSIGITQTIMKNSINSTKEALQFELISLMLYFLGNVQVTQDETDMINSYLDLDYPVGLYNRLVEVANEYDEVTATSETLLLYFIMVDNEMYKKQKRLETSLSLLLFDVYIQLGVKMLEHKDDSSRKNKLEDFRYRLHKTIIEREEFNYVNVENKSHGNSGEDIESMNLNEEQKETIDFLKNELNELVGLSTVKQDLNSLINLIRIRKIREERGMKTPEISLHLVFMGNPGTGKTTVARLLAKIYRHLGVLSKGHLVEVDRSDMVGGYVGQTAIKVDEVVQSALGGVLFIDEAYSLTANKNENDYGKEAVTTLLKAMEDYRDDFIVIVAGYPDLMEDFLKVNPGLESRFNRFIQFEDYDPEELVEIFKGMCKKAGYIPTDECIYCANAYFRMRFLSRDKNFANARTVRNFFEAALVNQANRLALDNDITDVELTTLTLDDVKNISIR